MVYLLSSPRPMASPANAHQGRALRPSGSHSARQLQAMHKDHMNIKGASVVAAMPKIPASGVPSKRAALQKPARCPAGPRPAISQASQASTAADSGQSNMLSSLMPSTLSPKSAVEAAITAAMAGGLDQ